MSAKIDDLGRVVIPIKLRERLDIQKQDVLDVYIEDGKIVLSKASEHCIFCNSDLNLSKIKTKNVCSNCIDEMNSI